MLSELARHPHAMAVLGGSGQPSHAYLFHGPGGAGKRRIARLLAASWLSEGERDPDGARARALSGAHPDLTWVTPSGAHEILVRDIDGPVVTAATRTPFESSRRVFVIEGADRLGDDAANRMLKTLEEPASFVHLILIADRLAEVLPTIRSRCLAVRFDGPSEQALAAELGAGGADPQTALALTRLSLGDAGCARELAVADGVVLRAAAERFVCQAVEGRLAGAPGAELLAAVRARGAGLVAELEAARQADLELYPRRERKRVETEWDERIKRGRRRVETAALDLALSLVGAWLLDLAALGWGAPELVRNVDRAAELAACAALARSGPELIDAVDLVEETRTRLQRNVTEELAFEALAYRLERTASRG